MKNNFVKIILIIGCLFFLNSEKRYLFCQEDYIQSILQKIRIDSVTKFVKELSGEIDVTLGVTTLRINSRYVSTEGNSNAEKYLLQKFNDFKVTARIQDYGHGGRNIIATKTGTKYPTMKYIICAHYDSYSSNTAQAPGADDNGSGTAAVLEAARVLSEYNTEYTIVFGLWDEEEIGLIGSSQYAQEAKNNNDIIMGVLNLDMIAYDGKNDSKLFVNYQPASLAFIIANKLTNINSTYNIGLQLVQSSSTSLASDQRSFNNVGYPAVLLIEDDETGDFNPCYHSPNDKIAYFNIPYYEKCVKLSVLSVASLAGVFKNTTSAKNNYIIPEKMLVSSYPNPFNSTANINFALPKAGRVSLIIYDQLGRPIETLFKGNLESGDHSFKWVPVDKPSGVYTLLITVNSKNEVARLVYVK
jgi:hypothetical protein